MSNLILQPDSRGAVIVCEHVARQGYPILRAIRDHPTMPEDTGWQFLCNRVRPEVDAEVWALEEIVAKDLSIAEFVNSPPGTELIRSGAESSWEITES